MKLSMLYLVYFMLLTPLALAEANLQPLVKVGTVANKVEFIDSLKVQGSLRAKNTAIISARLPGTIDEILVDEGEAVKAGQVLFQVDQVNLANAVALAKAADLKAQLDLKRMSRLIKDEAVTLDTFEKTEVMAKSSALKLAVAEKNLADSTVKAPFDGILTRKLKSAGDFVGAGMPVFILEDPSVYELCLSLNAAHYAKIAVGKTKINGATVTYKAQSVNPATRTFEIRAVVPKSDKLASGMIVDCEVVLARRTSQALPATAVALRGGENCIFKVVNNKVVRVPVTVGITNNGMTEILSPNFSASDNIITEGMLLVNENDEVRTQNVTR